MKDTPDTTVVIEGANIQARHVTINATGQIGSEKWDGRLPPLMFSGLGD